MFRIMIDPGHGGGDPGAVGNGLREKDLTLDISKRIRRILENEFDATVYMTRETDVFVELGERADIANKAGVDFFLSVHINAGGGTGFETYRHPNASAKTKSVQDVLHKAVVSALGSGIKDRGKKAANFAVLRLTKMPAVLTEVLFIDNPNDARLLKDEAFREKVARAHAEGIARAFGLTQVQPPLKAVTNGKPVRLLSGVFPSRESAEIKKKLIEEQFGITMYIVDP